VTTRRQQSSLLPIRSQHVVLIPCHIPQSIGGIRTLKGPAQLGLGSQQHALVKE